MKSMIMIMSDGPISFCWLYHTGVRYKVKFLNVAFSPNDARPSPHDDPPQIL